MAVLITIVPNPPKGLNPATVNVQGLTANTAYQLHVYQGQYAPEIRVPFTSDGSGKAAIPLVPQLPGGGAFTVEVLLTTTQMQASIQFTTTGPN